MELSRMEPKSADSVTVMVVLVIYCVLNIKFSWILTIEKSSIVILLHKCFFEKLGWTYNSATHCSHLDIYISQKTRLCVVNLEGQFQTSLEAKLINFLIWKFRSIILIFLLFFAGIVKSSAFWTLSMLFQKSWNVWVTFLHQIAI